MRNQKKMILVFVGILFFEVVFIQCIQLKIGKKTNEIQMENKREYILYHKIIKEMTCFPIAMQYRDDITFGDTFGADRENGSHDGCDLMYDDNKPGIVPVVSATDGTITNLGWLYLGGYRVGITSESGVYYYYAHFDSCAPGLYVGKTIRAGEFLGFMGNSGEGEVGTEGKFPVHLHFGIYVKEKDGNEVSINPYHYLLEINQD